MHMAITQKQIAEALGVSHQLVSFALNGGGTVSEARRREIVEAAHAMGYRRNELARAMVTGKSRILGLVTYSDTVEHIATIIAGALDEAVKDGYAVKVLHLPFNGTPEEVQEIAHRCTAWRLDGVVAVTLLPRVLDVLTPELRASGCPVAYVENSFSNDEDILVRTDDRSSFRAAVEHLVALGHRRIAHICGPDEDPISQARSALFLDVLREFELPVGPRSLIQTHPSLWIHRESIERAAHAMIEAPERPSAVVCSGDAAAMIVMRVARRRGLQVPEQLSVMGFGNFALGAHADPPLTTIAQPFREMGRLATRRLIEQISSNSSANMAADLASAGRGIHELPTRLVVRESTAPPA